MLHQIHFFEISYVLFIEGQAHFIVTLYYFSSFTLLSSVTFLFIFIFIFIFIFSLLPTFWSFSFSSSFLCALFFLFTYSLFLSFSLSLLFFLTCTFFSCHVMSCLVLSCLVLSFLFFSFLYLFFLIFLGEHPFKSFAPGLFQELRMNEGTQSLLSTPFLVLIILLKPYIVIYSLLQLMLLFFLVTHDDECAYGCVFIFHIAILRF